MYLTLLKALDSSKQYIIVYKFQFLPISYKILMTEICFVLKHQLLVNIHLCSHQTCIKQHSIRQSPSIKLWVVKVPSLFPISHGNFHLY